jgi:basic membrane protein A and related proteins
MPSLYRIIVTRQIILVAVIAVVCFIVSLFDFGKATGISGNSTNLSSITGSGLSLSSSPLPASSSSPSILLLSSSYLSLPENITSSSASNTRKLTVALLTDALFSDAGWGAFGYNAAQALHTKYGHKVDFRDNVAIPDIESTLRHYADSGYDLIIAQGYEWGKPAVKVGIDYPNTKFVVFTGLSNSSNVASIYPMQQEATYLLGALAAMMTKTGTIGFIGGERYPNLINMYEGYKQGAKDIEPNIKVLSAYLDNWDDPVAGKDEALSQINAGADHLLHVADTSGHGVIEAAKEKRISAFGAVSDQNKLAPDTVLTSFIIDVEKAFDNAVKMVQEQSFKGQIYKPGLEFYKGGPGDGIVYIASFHDLEEKVPDNVKQRLDQLKKQILEGTIVVPERYYENSTIVDLVNQ